MFAATAVPYELLSYQKAFPQVSREIGIGKLIATVYESDPPALAELCSGLDREVEQIINRGLAKAPIIDTPTWARCVAIRPRRG